MTEVNLSARANDRILKVSGTVADRAGSNSITPKHLSEATQYRIFDRSLGRIQIFARDLRRLLGVSNGEIE